LKSPIHFKEGQHGPDHRSGPRGRGAEGS
jgi:hypothetical protein